ncbi:MAG: hypothetical protein WD969_16895 [Paracoccaceae bacterium]
MRQIDGRLAPLMALAMAALLSLRLIAPGLIAPGPEGYIPICRGGQIVYLPVDHGPIKKSDDAPACPWLGLGAALAAPDTSPAPSAPPRAMETPAPPQRGHAAATLLPYRSRAPPQQV